MDDFMRSMLIKRVGQGEDIARAALFLCSDEADYITGVNLPVDGGWTASGGLGRPDPDLSKVFVQAMTKLASIPTAPGAE